MDPQNQNPVQAPTISQPPQPPSPPQIAVKPPSRLPLIIGGLVLLLIVGAGSYYLGNQSEKISKEAASTVVPTKELPSPSPKTSSVTIDNNETANWKTYTSEEYNFTLKYPSAVTQEETFDTQKFNKSHEFFKINGGSLEIYGLCGRGVQTIKTQDITIAGQKTIKLYETETRGVITAISRPNSNESICFNFILPEETVLNKTTDKLFDQILSTFKFTDEIEEVKNWKTFTDNEIGIKFKYPSDWGTLKKDEELCLKENGWTRLYNGNPCVHITLTTSGKDNYSFFSTESVTFYFNPPGRGTHWGDLSVYMINTPDKTLDTYCLKKETYLCTKQTNAEGISYIKSLADEKEIESTRKAFYYIVYTKNKDFPIIILSTQSFLDKMSLNDSEKIFDQIISNFKLTSQNEKNAEGEFCGGIAGVICPEGYDCKYDGNYPDTGGKCVKK